jgi:hypothetical protein
MIKKILLWLLLCGNFAWGQIPPTGTVYVDQYGSDSFGGRSPQTAKATIASAITACGSNPCLINVGGTFSVPSSLTIPANSKLYLVGNLTLSTGAQILLSSSSTLQGQGFQATQITGNVSGGGVVTNGNGSGGVTNARVADLTVTNNAAYSSSTYAIAFTNSMHTMIDEVYSYAPNANAVGILGSSYYSQVTNSFSSTNNTTGTGIYISANQTTVVGGAAGNGSIGIDCEAVSCNITDVDMEGASTYSVTVGTVSLASAIITGGYMQPTAGGDCVLFNTNSLKSVWIPGYHICGPPEIVDYGPNNLIVGGLGSTPGTHFNGVGAYSAPGSGGTTGLIDYGYENVGLTVWDYSQASGSQKWQAISNSGDWIFGPELDNGYVNNTILHMVRSNQTFYGNMIWKVNESGTQTVTLTQSDTLFASANATPTYSLPSCSGCGAIYTFVVNTNGAVTINPYSGESIGLGGASYGSLSSSVVGSTLTIIGTGLWTGAMQWSVVAMTGYWATPTVPTYAFASLPSVGSAGTQIYCTNCTTASTCASGGSGHMAVSNGSNWTCQ